MIKKAFTLQELLITLGIIGVVAVLALPALNGLKPDKNKTLYLKAYNTLVEQTNEVLDDSSLYWNENYNEEGEPEKVGLYAASKPSVAPYSKDDNCGGINKFAAILSHRLNIIGTPNYTTSAASFTTTDGINWLFETTKLEAAAGEYDKYKTNVTINVNPSNKDGDCLYSTECTNPNQFKFEIDNDGGITPADALGMAYLQDSTNMHTNGADRELATQIVSKAGSNSDVGKMSEALNEILGAENSDKKE